MALIHWEDVTQPSIYASSEADGCVIFLNLVVLKNTAIYAQWIWMKGPTPTTT